MASGNVIFFVFIVSTVYIPRIMMEFTLLESYSIQTAICGLVVR